VSPSAPARQRRQDLVAIDLDEVRHKPLPARSPRGHQPVTETLARLQARIAGLEAELAAEQQRSAGHRGDCERERADRMVATQDRLVVELETLRGLLAAIQEAARPRTSWLGGWRWLLKAS
jgi:polynucleotide 5'-kinase involved in rRNA processing